MRSGETDFQWCRTVQPRQGGGPGEYAAVFSACPTVVHHGGAGITAARLRAGVPTVSLGSLGSLSDQKGDLRRPDATIKVGLAQPFSETTPESLVADLGEILVPQYATRAREIAARMTKPAESIGTATN